MQSQIFTAPTLGRPTPDKAPVPGPELFARKAPEQKVERPDPSSPELPEADAAPAPGYLCPEDRFYAQAEAILSSDLFRPSCCQTERLPITCTPAVCDALDELAEAHAPFILALRERDSIEEISQNEDGLVPIRESKDGKWHTNPVLEEFERKLAAAEKPYSAAETALTNALTVNMTANIVEALELAGVTDNVLVAEICRCVIHGGGVFDGKGFTRDGGLGSPTAPKLPTPNLPAPKPFTPHELSAPNPALNRAMNNRIEALLQKHEPDIFPQWLAHMEALGKGRDTNVQWGQSIAYAASLIPIANRNPAGWDAPEAFEQFKGRAHRNRDLLVRLVLKGIVRREKHMANSKPVAGQAVTA